MTATEDLFTPIHKGLRAMIYSLSGRLQTNDFADTASTTALVTDLEHEFEVARSAGCILCVLSHHATDEETQIFPASAKVGSRLIAELIEEHHELTRREVALSKSAHELLAMDSPERRVEAGVRLNQAANELFGAYLVHMNREETELVPLMREHFSNEQMAAMRGAIIGQMPPDRFFVILGWMLPSLNVGELAEFVGGVRRGAPPQVFQAMTDLCSAKVEPTRWNAVKLRVGL
jgi:hypothetical protein